jgi:hypothetical protein
MINRERGLPIAKQAEVLSISRGCVYYLPRPVPERDLDLMRRMALIRNHANAVPLKRTLPRPQTVKPF